MNIGACRFWFSALALLLILFAQAVIAQRESPRRLKQSSEARRIESEISDIIPPSPLGSRPVSEPLPTGPKTIDVQSLMIPEKAVREFQNGMKLLREGKFEGACRHLEKAVRVYPGFVEAHTNLGIAHFALNQHESAERAFLKAIALDPDREIAHFNSGLYYLRTQRFSQALTHLSKALALDDTNPATHMYLGETLFRLGKLEESKTALHRALALEPSSPLARDWLKHVEGTLQATRP